MYANATQRLDADESDDIQWRSEGRFRPTRKWIHTWCGCGSDMARIEKTDGYAYYCPACDEIESMKSGFVDYVEADDEDELVTDGGRDIEYRIFSDVDGHVSEYHDKETAEERRDELEEEYPGQEHYIEEKELATDGGMTVEGDGEDVADDEIDHVDNESEDDDTCDTCGTALTIPENGITSAIITTGGKTLCPDCAEDRPGRKKGFITAEVTL